MAYTYRDVNVRLICTDTDDTSCTLIRLSKGGDVYSVPTKDIKYDAVKYIGGEDLPGYRYAGWVKPNDAHEDNPDQYRIVIPAHGPAYVQWRARF